MRNENKACALFFIPPIEQQGLDGIKRHEQPDARLFEGKGTSYVNSFEPFAMQAQNEMPQREFYTANFANFSRPIFPWNPFPRRKNSSIGSDTWLPSDGDRRQRGSKALWRANDPAQVTSPRRRTYLATNWQQIDVIVLFTSKDRRFPTPQPTTSHLFWPNQRRKTSILTTDSATDSDLGEQQSPSGTPRGGGSSTLWEQNTKSEWSHRRFCTHKRDQKYRGAKKV